MKKIIIFFFVIIVIGCQKNSIQNDNNAIQQLPIKYNILIDAPYDSKYIKALTASKLFGEYTFNDCSQNQADTTIRSFVYNFDDNNFYDNKNNFYIHLHDSISKTEIDGKKSYTLIRYYTPSSTPSAHLVNYNSNSYSIELQSAQPIYLIRPIGGSCQRIPFCYYDNMEIEWNADINNPNGVLILVEWTGSTLNGVCNTNSTILGIDLVEDIGTTVLDNEIFNDIPDEALVNLWLIRGNIVEFEQNNCTSINDIIDSLAVHQEDYVDFINNNPDFLLNLLDVIAVNGAIAVLPFYLIREL
ncbi:MAG: hypothetical protein MJZ82_01125 [Paludibacteraceae bacterium]|nr:hypothetical protein [Paludibacteraceae bacterium]